MNLVRLLLEGLGGSRVANPPLSALRSEARPGGSQTGHSLQVFRIPITLYRDFRGRAVDFA
jgi:hypothetical protein